jgi:hypothetical protein
MAIAIVVIVGVLGIAMFEGILTYTPITGPSYYPAGAGKTLTCSGVVNLASGAASGAFGNMMFFDPTSGNLVNQGAIAAGGVFSVNLPSGINYIAFYQPTGGNAPVYQWRTFPGTSVPYTDPQSFTTVYQFPNFFTIYAKATTWSMQLQSGATTATRTYTAGAWGGTQTGASSITYTLTPVAGTPVVFVAIFTNTNTFSQLGVGDTYYTVTQGAGSYTATAVSQYFVVATNRTDAYLYSGPAGSFSFKLNATIPAFAFPVPVVQTGVAQALASISFQIVFPTTSTGGQLYGYFITNTTASALQNMGLVSPYPAVWTVFNGRLACVWHLQ